VLTVLQTNQAFLYTKASEEIKVPDSPPGDDKIEKAATDKREIR
jgi:hypothetical protein